MDLISTTTLLSFLMTCTVIELTPGPNMAYLAVLSASEGRKSGFATTVGIALGLSIIGIASALGVGALISSSELAYQALRWGGVLYLFWLAWDSWKPEKEISPKDLNSNTRNFKFFKRGLIVNLLNPKAAIFYVAILPQFIFSPSSALVQAITLTIIYVALATSIHCTIVVMAGATYKILQDRQRRLIARRVLSLALVVIALWFAQSTAKY